MSKRIPTKHNYRRLGELWSALSFADREDLIDEWQKGVEYTLTPTERRGLILWDFEDDRREAPLGLRKKDG